MLRGTGSALTSYVYDNSPAGEGAAPQKAYAAAFVLLVFVLGLNLLVDRIGRSHAEPPACPWPAGSSERPGAGRAPQATGSSQSLPQSSR